MIHIAPSEVEENKFFIFRENGREIPFTITDNKIHCYFVLTNSERSHIRRYFMSRPFNESDNLKIVRMHLEGYTDNYISVQLRINKTLVERTTRQYWENKFGK